MDKPKIVSMKEALDLPQEESEVPELPGNPPASEVPNLPAVPVEEEHPPEVPPERIAPIRPPMQTPTPESEPAAPAQPASSPSPQPEPTLQAPAASQTTILPQPESPIVSVPLIASQPASAESKSETTPVVPPAPVQPPSGVPPWVGREPQHPTVAEAAKPIPSYPGVGRPRINSISQGAVSLTPPAPVTAPIRPSATTLASPSAGKLYDRPELDADRFAEEMAAVKEPTPVQKDVVQEYRQAAQPPKPTMPPRPLTPEEERAKAKSLASEIHAKNEQAGFFGKLKRMMGLR